MKDSIARIATKIIAFMFLCPILSVAVYSLLFNGQDDKAPISGFIGLLITILILGKHLRKAIRDGIVSEVMAVKELYEIHKENKEKKKSTVIDAVTDRIAPNIDPHIDSTSDELPASAERSSNGSASASEPKNESQNEASTSTESVISQESQNFNNSTSPKVFKVDTVAPTCEYYKKYRIVLQEWSHRLTELETRIEDDLKIRKAQIAERERASLEKIKSASDSAHEYSRALLDAEYRIIDYAKRFDAKENTIFSEIQEGAEKFRNHNSSPMQDGFQFETEFSKVLIANGFKKVVVTAKSGDYGGDITAEKDGVKYVVQCKYYTSMVGIDAVQQVCGAKIHYGAHVGVVATNSVFTHAAKILAEEAGIFLWDCETVDSMKKAAESGNL